MFPDLEYCPQHLSFKSLFKTYCHLKKTVPQSRVPWMVAGQPICNDSVNLGYKNSFPHPSLGTVLAPKLPVLISTVHNKLPPTVSSLKWVMNLGAASLGCSWLKVSGSRSHDVRATVT